MKRSLFVCTLLSIAACSVHAQTAGPLDFETSGQLSGSFRPTLGSAFASQASSGTQNFLEVNLTGATSNPWIAVYDTTPADSGDPYQTFAGRITLSIDVSAGQTNTSFGVFFLDAGNNSNNLLTILNLDSAAGAAGNEQIRFWKDTAITGSAVGTIYTAASGLFTGTNGATDTTTNSWVTNAAVRDEMKIDQASPFDFYTVTFTYDPFAATLRVAAPAFSAVLSIPAGDLIANPAIALRVNDPSFNDSNNARVDNFSVIPEPITASLFGFAGVALALRRPRRRP